MVTIKDKMLDLAEEIDDFIRNNESNRKPANKFPFKKYKDLNQRIYEMHVEMAKKDSNIIMSDGIEWFREQAKKLSEFLPDDEN